jgi:hypothetical protein
LRLQDPRNSPELRAHDPDRDPDRARFCPVAPHCGQTGRPRASTRDCDLADSMLISLLTTSTIDSFAQVNQSNVDRGYGTCPSAHAIGTTEGDPFVDTLGRLLIYPEDVTTRDRMA